MPSSVEVGGGTICLPAAPGGVKPAGMGMLRSRFFMNLHMSRKYQGALMSDPSIELLNDRARWAKI